MYTNIGYWHNKRKKKIEARIWIDKAYDMRHRIHIGNNTSIIIIYEMDKDISDFARKRILPPDYGSLNSIDKMKDCYFSCVDGFRFETELKRLVKNGVVINHKKYEYLISELIVESL